MRPMLSIEIATDSKTATIYVRSRKMKRYWRRQDLPTVTKMTFSAHSWVDLPGPLSSLLRDALNKGCATSLERLRFRRAICLQLHPYSTTEELYRIWKEYTGEDLSVSSASGSGHYPTGFVGMPWRPTR